MKATHVMRREYRESVRKKSFIVSTILVPVFMLAFFIIPIAMTTFVPDRSYDVVVLDATGEIGEAFVAALIDTLDSGERKYSARAVDARGDGFDAARALWLGALSRGEVDMVLDVRESVFDDGKAAYITREERGFQILEDFENALTEIVIKRRLAREGLDYARVKKLATNVRLDMNQINAAGDVEEKHFLAEWGVVFVFVMMLYTALLTWGMSVSRGIVEEKGSRVIEVLLSSLRPRDLLLGKVVGLGLAGLTQMAIWSGVGLVLTVYTAGPAVAALESVHVSPATWLYFFVYFLLGFLLYASIFTVVGSISSTEQDAQQLQGLVTMPMIIPILVLMFIVQSPNSPLAVVLSLIPPFTPMVMLARIILLEPPAWQVALSIAFLAVSIYWAISFSARVFRVGILMYGKRPSLREIVRWYRQAG
jgi:ABC-2 type transport system permease protein